MSTGATPSPSTDQAGQAGASGPLLSSGSNGPVHLAQYESAIRVEDSTVEMRKNFLKRLMQLFIALNLVVCFILAGLAVSDWLIANQVLAQISRGTMKAEEFGRIPRVVDSSVVMSLIGATVVQVGASVYLVTKSLFSNS